MKNVTVNINEKGNTYEPTCTCGTKISWGNKVGWCRNCGMPWCFSQFGIVQAEPVYAR